MTTTEQEAPESVSESAVEPQSGTQVEQGVEDVREAAKGLHDLFATLVPPEEIEICDVFGGEYRVRAVLPARRQIVVMRQIEALLAVDANVGALAGSGVEGIAGALVALASNEVVLDGISSAFAAAHPAVVASARARAIEAGLDRSDAEHPADLFAIEELVGGLVPFFVRLVAKMIDLFGAMIGASETVEAA
jgi:hypothetical protein